MGRNRYQIVKNEYIRIFSSTIVKKILEGKPEHKKKAHCRTHGCNEYRNHWWSRVCYCTDRRNHPRYHHAENVLENTQDQNRTKFFGGNMTRGMGMFGGFGYHLTTDQQTELQQIMTTLRDQNATHQEMQSAIQQKLEEFGMFDTQLNNQIAQTEQRLTILNREKELRNQGYNWTEVWNMIQNEFDLQNSTNGDLGMKLGQGFGREPSRGPNGG